MVELILVYCLAGQASVCREERPLVAEQLSLNECMFTAQPIAVDYIRAHPQWALHGWRCRMDGPAPQPK